MTDFEQMAREYIYHMLATHGVAHADDLVRLEALLRRVADAENEACEATAREHYIGSMDPSDYRYCCDIEEKIAARRKNRSGT